jgi:ubiquinone/menaquinone biosynthesis C-methylase UbiE
VQGEKNCVCPVRFANHLTGSLRKWLQDPVRILSPFVKEGMTVLDVGCGPGYFSTALAALVGNGGTVIAADLQDGMLEKLRERIRGTELEARIRPIKCDSGNINVTEKVDFALAFWMVHEVPDKEAFFRQLRVVATAGTQILMVEPKLFHVSRREFQATTGLAEHAGFQARPGPRLAFSWSAVLTSVS